MTNRPILRTQKPKHIGMIKDKNIPVGRPVTITNWYFESEMPKKYDPFSTLVIPTPDCSERDRVFGSYFSMWGELEFSNNQLLSKFVGLELGKAAPYLALGLNVRDYSNFILGQAHGKIPETVYNTLVKYLEAFKRRNAVRNKLIHGHWTAMLTLSLIHISEPTRPY